MAPKEDHSFFARHKKFITYGAIIAVVIVLLFAAFRLTLRVNFLLGDDLLLHVDPQKVSLQTHYGNTSTVQFSVSAANFPYCVAQCTYSFTDKSRNRVLDSGNITLQNNDVLNRSYTISISRVGRGQDVYSFDIGCKNSPSFMCLTTGVETRRSAPVLVNYDLAEDEKQAKEQVRQNFIAILQNLKALDVEIKKLNERTKAISSAVLLTDILDEKAALEEQFAQTLIEIERLKTLWNAEGYIELSASLNGSQEARIVAMDQELRALNESISLRVHVHNDMVGRFKRLEQQLEGNQWGQLATKDPVLSQYAGAARQSINQTTTLFASRTYNNYEELSTQLNTTEQLVLQFGHRAKEYLLIQGIITNVLVQSEYDYRCMLQGDNCNTTSTISSLYSTYHAESQKPWWQMPRLASLCSQYELLEQQFNSTFTGQQDNSLNSSANMLGAYLKEIVMKNYNASLQDIDDQVFLNATKPLIIIQNIAQQKDNETLRRYLFNNLKLSIQTQQHKDQVCSVSQAKSLFSAPSEYMMHSQLIIEQPYQVESSIETELSDNPPLCCIFGECNPCCITPECANDSSTYPIIFLHGHAFTKGSSAAYSLDAFGMIQAALEEEGYINAGIITAQTTTNGVPGEWGLSGKPVSIKASYYYDQFLDEGEYIIVPTKSENIDTYALRLRDIVAAVQKNTGKSKVIIVSHSMGGLVARRYMQIFGDESVHKLVMVGTPNFGVIGRVRDYCPVFGEQKECLDMQQGSLFLNKLNDPASQPKNTKLYTISGSGCLMDNKEGDGVVLVEDVHLTTSQNFNIEGVCTGLFGEVLHTAMLNTQKYPQTLDIIKKILTEE